MNKVNIEDIIIIWLDEDINEDHQHYQDSINHLQTLNNSFKTFHDTNQCIDFFTDITNKKVFFILSNSLGRLLMPCIDDVLQLDSVYIYSNIPIPDQQWINHWNKIQGIFVDIFSLLNRLKTDIKQCENILTSISVISASSAANIDELPCSFMYSQLLKEILLSMKYDQQTKRRFIDYLHTLYADNRSALAVIDQFEREYEEQSPAWWYTKEAFIYFILNTALRAQDVDVIIKMGFFIQDLHEQIKGIHIKNEQKEKLILYRGPGMSMIDFENMRTSEGGLISFNSFLSTSTNREISYLFADSARQKSDTVGILLVIEIDPSISTIPFASLKDISYYSNEQNNENEILFSMHTVYRIGQINQIDNHFWQVNLTLTNDNDAQLKHLTDYVRQELGGANGSHSLVSLLIKMGDFSNAEQISHTLFQTASNR